MLMFDFSSTQCLSLFIHQLCAVLMTIVLNRIFVRYHLVAHCCSTKKNLPMPQSGRFIKGKLLRYFRFSALLAYFRMLPSVSISMPCNLSFLQTQMEVLQKRVLQHLHCNGMLKSEVSVIFLASLIGFDALNQRSVHAWRHLEDERQTNATQCARANWSCRDVRHHRWWISNP